MKVDSEKIYTVTLTEEEARGIREEVVKLLRDCSFANSLSSLNTLNNIIGLELARVDE